MLEKILEEIENAFNENEKNIKDENGVHHLVIDSFTAIFLVKKIIRKHMNDGWIPVLERLPKDEHCVLVCDVRGARDVAWWDGKRWCTGFSHADVAEDIIAWQPLPGPYTLKKETETDCFKVPVDTACLIRSRQN